MDSFELDKVVSRGGRTTRCDPAEVLPAEQVAAKAELELNETTEKRQEALVELRSLIEKGIEGFTRTDDRFLLRFLRCRKFDAKAAFINLRSYAEFRQQYPEYFEGTAASSQDYIASGVCGILPQRLPGGEVLLLLHPAKQDLKRFSLDDFMKALVYMSECLLQSTESQVCGFVVLEDLADYGLMRARQIPAVERRRVYHFLQYCVPARLKAVHVIHTPPIMSAIMLIARRFIKKKMRDRCRAYWSDRTLLLEQIGADRLPVQFGGNLHFDTRLWVRNQMRQQ